MRNSGTFYVEFVDFLHEIRGLSVSGCISCCFEDWKNEGGGWCVFLVFFVAFFCMLVKK